MFEIGKYNNPPKLTLFFRGYLAHDLGQLPHHRLLLLGVSVDLLANRLDLGALRVQLLAHVLRAATAQDRKEGEGQRAGFRVRFRHSVRNHSKR